MREQTTPYYLLNVHRFQQFLSVEQIEFTKPPRSGGSTKR